MNLRNQDKGDKGSHTNHRLARPNPRRLLSGQFEVSEQLKPADLESLMPALSGRAKIATGSRAAVANHW
jgi:hypothetical protein